MFAIKTIEQQALDLRRENVRLKEALDKRSADIEYIAMMTDVELETDEVQTEVENNE